MDINIHNVTKIKSTKRTFRTGDDRFFTRSFTIYYTHNGQECEQELTLYSDKWYRLEIEENENADSPTLVTENV